MKTFINHVSLRREKSAYRSEIVSQIWSKFFCPGIAKLTHFKRPFSLLFGKTRNVFVPVALIFLVQRFNFSVSWFDDGAKQTHIQSMWIAASKQRSNDVPSISLRFVVFSIQVSWAQRKKMGEKTTYLRLKKEKKTWTALNDVDPFHISNLLWYDATTAQPTQLSSTHWFSSFSIFGNNEIREQTMTINK